MKRLRKLRTDRHLVLRTVAEAIHVSVPMLSKYERDERDPSLEVLKRLSKYFDVSTDYLLELTDDPNPRKVDLEQLRADPQLLFQAGIEKDMDYDSLSPEGKGEMYKFFQYARTRYPREERR